MRRQRILRTVRWPIFFIVVGGFFLWLAIYSSGACAPGPPEFKASDLLQATVKNMYPPGGGPPVTTPIDLTEAGEVDRLLAAYQSMKPTDEAGRITVPGLYLDLELKGDRKIEVVLDKDNRTDAEIREYQKGELKRSFVVKAGAMFDYVTSSG